MTTRRRAWLLAALGALLIAVTLVQAALHIPGELGIGGYDLLVEFVEVWAVAGAVYLCAVALVLRGADGVGRLGLGIVLVVAVLIRVAPFLDPPFLSSDIYRYVWDGRVQAAGINPYCCIPSAPELGGLRDAAIYPHINRSDYAPTIYPPVAQMFFGVVARMSDSVTAMKAAMLFAEAVAIAAMVALLARAGLPRNRVLIYAWHPVAVWEYAGNGHVDALAIGLIGLALLVASVRREALSGVALAAATLTKFLPVVIAPALWRGVGPRRPPLWAWPKLGAWRLPLAFVATAIVAYACYLSVGMRVFGFLGGYASEEGLGDGGGIYALQLLSNFATVPRWAAPLWLALTAAVLAGVAIRIVWISSAPRDVARMGADALLLATIFTVAVSPHYAWYFGWLAYLACLAPWPSVIFLTIACVACYLDTSHTKTGWASVLYLPFALLAVRDLWRARVRNPSMTRSF